MERVCNLYINDTHLMIKLFEHIKKEIDIGTKVILLSQESSKSNIKNMKERIKQQKLPNNIQIVNSLGNSILKKCNNTTIIIQGSNSFIEETESVLNNLIKMDNLEINIISCYNITKELNVNEILNKYEKILNTNGIEEINRKVLEKTKK